MRESRAGGLETLDLRRVEGIAGDLGRDEMADQEVGPARGPMRLHRRLQAGEGLEAEPVHAGVEMQSARRRPAASRGEGGPALKLLFAADRGREAMLDIVLWIGPALEAVEHIDPSLRRQRPPRRDPLAEMGDEEDARPAPIAPARLRDADPVSVGLDDGGAAPGRGGAQVAPIVGQRGKVDPKAPRRARGAMTSITRDLLHHRRRRRLEPGCASTSRRAKPQRSNRRSFSGSSSRVLSVILRRRGASPPFRRPRSASGRSRGRAPGATDTRATWSASSFRLHSTPR